MKILFLSRWFPYPTNNGSKLRIYNLLRGLATCHEVTLLSFADQLDADPDTPEIRALCSDVHLIPWREFNPNSARARFGFLSVTPRSIVDTFSSEMAQQITKLVNTHRYDVVVASQLSMASYRPYFRNISAVFEELEIGLGYDQSTSANPLKHLRHMFTWLKLRAYLSRLLNTFQACTVVSEREQQLLLNNFSLQNTTVKVIPNCLDVSNYKNHKSSVVSNQIIFSGSFRYHPNYEAMLWYIEKVHPYVVDEIPDVNLVITGDHANLPLPAGKNIVLTGYVNDIVALISSSSASIAPLLSGGGTRLKILEAMAIGIPVVSTSKGTEGLMVQNGKHLLVADEPERFAENVIAILRDQELGRRIASNAQRLVRENYDWLAVMPRFLGLVEQTIVG